MLATSALSATIGPFLELHLSSSRHAPTNTDQTRAGIDVNPMTADECVIPLSIDQYFRRDLRAVNNDWHSEKVFTFSSIESYGLCLP